MLYEVITITVTLENGKTIEVDAPENSADNRYVESMTFNGKDYDKNYLKYEELLKGAKISYKMGA